MFEGWPAMTILLFIGGIVSIVTACAGTLLALRIQYRWLSREQIERQAWERAQEGHQLNWEKQQRKRSAEIELGVASQVEQIQEQWMEWEAMDQDRSNRLRLEYELLHLPTIDEMPLLQPGPDQACRQLAGWRPPLFERASLRGYDFSHRYLGHAYLRGADLAGAIFYMADLRNACLAGANLSGAILTGANLSGTDLRGASLAGATLLVADLDNTLLQGADLRGARSLSIQQVYTAHYDHTTLLDSELDITMPRPATSRPPITAPGITSGLLQPVLDASLLLPQAPGD